MAKSKSKLIRDVTIAQKHMQGMSYSEIAKQQGISKMTVCRALKKEEIREILDQGTNEMIQLIPKAVSIQERAMKDYDINATLAVKASETILKTGAIIPSNTVNATITNIYNQQNNIITAETMELVRKLLPGFNEEVIDADTN
jgi:lambda repressor-like predicted transcriptional regulator